MRRMNIGTIPSITTTRYRPLGSSIFKPAPWNKVLSQEYIPSRMSIDALRKGLIKANQLECLIPEDLVERARIYLTNYLRGIWTFPESEAVLTYDEALTYVTRDKSPGYPFYYNTQTKGDLLEADGKAVRRLTDSLLIGIREPCYFNLTLKSELRHHQKVEEDKTRVFMASPMHHLMACYVLFTKQNEYLQDNRSKHPITIGIQLPGPEYVRRVASLGMRLNDGDVSGCDLRFNLRLARVIRDIRSAFLPEQYRSCVRYLYDSVYCGVGVTCGNLYRIYGNKSGWHNTGHDNSIQVWLWLIMASYHFAPSLDPGVVFKALINGDDLLINWLLTWNSFKDVCIWLEGYRFYIEADNWHPRSPEWCVFLSHHLEERFVAGFGDILVAAGNLPKLLSSINWIKTNKNLTFEESSVAHLVGIRFCLFPWAIYFEEVDQLLSRYLETVEITPFMRSCLQARFNERQFALLHTRMESLVFSGHSGIEEIDEALNGVPSHLIKLIQSFCVMTKTKSQKARTKNARKNAVAVARGIAPPLPPRTARVPKRRRNVKKPPKSNLGTEGKIAKIGRYIGTGAKAFFKAVTGFGDYKVATNSIMAKNEVPIVNNPSQSAGVVVRHREYIRDISSFEVFNNISFPINPGLPELFPWLSSTAANFEEYQIRGMIFEYKSMASNLNTASSTSALGTVIMATDYNVLNPKFPDKRTMENYEFACSAKPSETFVHPLECAKNQSVNTHLFVRTTDDFGASGDQRLYDMGSFQIACQGMPPGFDNTSVGELWCTYEIEFFKPRLAADTGLLVLSDAFAHTGSTTVSLFGTTEVAKDGSTCGCTLSNNTIIFPPTCHGRFEITLFLGTANSGTNASPIISGGLYSTVKYTQGIADIVGGLVQSNTHINGTWKSCIITWYVDITNGINNEPPTVVFDWTGGTTGFDCYLSINQITPGFNDIAPTQPPSAVKTREEKELEKRIEHLEEGVRQFDFKEMVREEIRNIVLTKQPGDPSIDAAFSKMSDEQKRKLLEILGSK